MAGLVVGVVAGALLFGPEPVAAPRVESGVAAPPSRVATSPQAGGATGSAPTAPGGAEGPVPAAQGGAAATAGPAGSAPSGAADQPADRGPEGSAPATSEPRQAQAAPPAPPARGVTDDTLRVGVAIPDLGAIRHLGPEFDAGDPEEQWRAMVDGWERDGLVPVHGRRLEFVYRRYDVIDPSTQRSACVGFIEDDEVFLVASLTYFEAGIECVAREYGTPMLTGYGAGDDVYERSAPFLFTLGMSNSRIVRNMVHWAHHSGILPGTTIGIYHANNPIETRLVEVDIVPALRSLGYEPAVVHSTDQTLGGPQDAVAVQRFRQAGVDLAILLTSKAGFMQQAQAQSYRPTYVESDHQSGTSDTAAARYPAEQFDGTRGLTGRRVGEENTDRPMDPAQQACIDNYHRYAGREVDFGSTEWNYVLVTCDVGHVLLDSLTSLGSRVTPGGWVGAMETSFVEYPLRRQGPITFRPDKHHGVESARTVEWSGDCTCWAPVTEFGPLWVR